MTPTYMAVNKIYFHILVLYEHIHIQSGILSILYSRLGVVKVLQCCLSLPLSQQGP